MPDDLTREEIHARLDRFAADLLDAAGVAEPPIDAVALAARHFGLALELDPDADSEARHAAAAYAIAAHLKRDILAHLGLDPTQRRPMLGESPTGLLADRLLVPTAWLADEGRACGWDLLALKERFRTAGHERIALRLLDLDEPCVIAIIDDGRVSKRRSNALRVNKKLSAPEARVQQYVHSTGRPHELSADGWRVQGWPLHASDRKREILRGIAEDY